VFCGYLVMGRSRCWLKVKGGVDTGSVLCLQYMQDVQTCKRVECMYE